MRTFKRLEIEMLGSDAFGLGGTTRTLIRQLEGGQPADIYEAGSTATAKIYTWLKENYFGYDLLRKMMVNSYIDALTDKNLAELLKRVLPDARNVLESGATTTPRSVR